MSSKAVLYFSIWTSLLSAIFYHFYTMWFSFGIPWIMFVCMAIYFGMGLQPKDSPGLLLSAYCGLAWGQFDFLLISLFTGLGLGMAGASFLSIVIGTTITMYIHIKLLGGTPIGHMPIIFAGVCLTFSQGGGNVPGLIVTFAIGILLVTLCSLGQVWCMKKFPLEAEK